MYDLESNLSDFEKHVALDLVATIKIQRVGLGCGWIVSVDLIDNRGYYDIRTSRGDIRYWVRLDTLLQSLEKCGYTVNLLRASR